MNNIYKQFSDENLVSLLKSNDKKAFEEIYERYFALLYNYTFRKLQLKEEAQDIVQEVLFNFWKRSKDLVVKESLDVYLFSSVRNKAFDYFAHLTVEKRYLDNLTHYINSSANNSDYLVRESSFKQLIEDEINALPPRMQEIFRLSREKNLTNKEVAELLNLSTHTIDTQVKRALKILKVRLGPYFIFIFF